MKSNTDEYHVIKLKILLSMNVATSTYYIHMWNWCDSCAFGDSPQVIKHDFVEICEKTIGQYKIWSRSIYETH